MQRVRAFLPYILLSALIFFLTGCTNDNGSTPPQALSSPARVAAVGSDAIVVSDYSENKFCFVAKSTLAVTNCFQAKGQPTGVAYADYRGGRYFVGNRSVRSVDIFDTGGNFLGHLGGKTGLFQLVNDLAVNEDDEFVYVLDAKTARIDVYDFAGNLFVSDLTSGGLVRPTAIEFDPITEQIFVSDFGDPGTGVLPRIRIYDEGGAFLDEIAAIETGGLLNRQQTFSSPQGMFLYNGLMFFVDSGSSEVQVYDLSTKALVKTIGVRGQGDGELFYPLDVFVDSLNGDVFVADNRNGRVSVFRGEGEVP